MNRLLLTGFLLFAVSYSGCKKEKQQTELEKLPPATQEGRNTFGCLINGQAWMPKGYDWREPNFYMIVDPGFSYGNISIRTYRLLNEYREDLTINSDTIKNTGTYLISDTSRTRPVFFKHNIGLTFRHCEVPYNGRYNRKGFLKITRYDLQNGIVSGEFEMKMVNPACGYGDTIRITNGRFDYKL